MMGVEIEAKLRVENLQAVRAKLVSLGAKPLGVRFEVNTFFDTKDRMLLRDDRGLRVRTLRFTDGRIICEATYKGPRSAGEFKQREEIEFHPDDPEAVEAMFERLGFEKTLSFEKRRESFNLDDATIELDELPVIGSFVEIECDSIETIRAIRSKLDLDAAESVTKSYVGMLDDAVRAGRASGPIIRL